MSARCKAVKLVLVVPEKGIRAVVNRGSYNLKLNI
jgi:hypothetical protein